MGVAQPKQADTHPHPTEGGGAGGKQGRSQVRGETTGQCDLGKRLYAHVCTDLLT